MNQVNEKIKIEAKRIYNIQYLLEMAKIEI